MKLFAAICILLGSTSAFASARIPTPKDLRWVETPRILSVAACEGIYICVGNSITENRVSFLTCKTNSSTDCPDAKACFNKQFTEARVNVAEAAEKVESALPSTGRNPEREVGSSIRKDVRPFVTPAGN